jgi:WD40 repeat protein
VTSATLSAPPASERKPPASPFKGLTPYTEEDVDFFFGREQETEIIRANLLASRLTLLYGESGVGKSSVLHAGAAHRLRQEARRNLESTGRPELAVVVFRTWRDDPVAGLLREVERAVTHLVGEAAVDLPDGAGLDVALHAWAERLDGDLLVVLDQFEEYFLYHEGEDGPGTFAHEFPRAVNRLDLRVSFLVSIREDALAKLDLFKGRVPGLFDNRLRIDHLSRSSARAAIEGPVRAYNERVPEAEAIAVEPELVDAVLDQIGGRHVNLGHVGAGAADGAGTPAAREELIQAPYLQLVVTRIWNEELAEGSRVLRASTLEHCGGAETIVRTRLDEALASLSPEEQDVAAAVFHFLVTRSGAKVAHTAADLASYTELPEPQVTHVVEDMAGGDIRILRPVPPPPGSDGATRYEIFHDVIGPAILDWRARHTEAAARREAEARARRERRKTRIWAAVAVLSLAACAAVAVLAVWAVGQKETAETERRTARAHALAAQASLELGVDPARSADLALDALELRETPGARRVLVESLADLRVTNIVPGVDDEWWAAAASTDPRRPYLLLPGEKRTVRVVNARTGGELSVLRGHKTDIVTVALSPDALRAVTVDWNDRARIWNTETGKVLHVLPATVAAVAFGPKRRLAVADYEGRLALWDAESGRRLARSRVPGQEYADDAVFSADGTRLLTSGYGVRAHLWDVSQGRLAHIGALRKPGQTEASGVNAGAAPVEFGGGFQDADLSGDGREIVTVGENGLVRLWDAATLRLRRTLRGPAGESWGAEFSRDGRLVAAMQETTVGVWRTDTGRLVSEMRRDIETVNDIAFSADGRGLAVAYDDGTVRIWDVSTGHQVLELRGHSGAVFLTAFLGDGRSLVTTVGEDGTARTWNVDTGMELRGHRDWVVDLAVSPVRDMVATVGDDGDLITWDFRTGRKLGSTEVARFGIGSVQFSRDGSDILTASFERGTALWSTDSFKLEASYGRDATAAAAPVGAAPAAPVGAAPAAPVGAAPAAPLGATVATFSPDGTRVLAGVIDGTARIWDRDTKKELVRLRYAGSSDVSIAAVAYSPDGTRIATVGDDDVVRIWDAKTGKQLREVDVHQGAVHGVAFHPRDSNLAVTAGRDRSAVVWSVRTGRPVVTLPHGEAVTTATFSADGTRIVTGGPSGSVRVWEWRSTTLLGAMRVHADRVNAAEFSPDGTTIASAAGDGLAKIYACTTCVPLAELRREAEELLRELGLRRSD